MAFPYDGGARLRDAAYGGKKLQIPDFIVINAVRYAIGRMTYAVEEMCQWLIENWERIEDRTRTIVQVDIDHAIAYHEAGTRSLGMQCDYDAWCEVQRLWK